MLDSFYFHLNIIINIFVLRNPCLLRNHMETEFQTRICSAQCSTEERSHPQNILVCNDLQTLAVCYRQYTLRQPLCLTAWLWTTCHSHTRQVLARGHIHSVAIVKKAPGLSLRSGRNLNTGSPKNTSSRKIGHVVSAKNGSFGRTPKQVQCVKKAKPGTFAVSITPVSIIQLNFGQ
jgi:hypothetical protein